MFGSFVSALSGLKAAGTAIDVIGNDLANLNTQGFKVARYLFRTSSPMCPAPPIDRLVQVSPVL
jgi:flagellar hook protein FlgE